jgi:hypothetical protein
MKKPRRPLPAVHPEQREGASNSEAGHVIAKDLPPTPRTCSGNRLQMPRSSERWDRHQQNARCGVNVKEKVQAEDNPGLTWESMSRSAEEELAPWILVMDPAAFLRRLEPC